MTDQTGPTQPSQLSGAIFNGVRIAPLKAGSIMGWRRGNQIIRSLNALLTWKLKTVDGPNASIAIGDSGVSLSLPKGGAGGTGTSTTGKTLMQLVSYHQDAANGDYLVCRPPGGAGDGSDDVNVAVEPQLQSGLGHNGSVYSQTMPDGNTWLYTAYDATLQKRTSTCGSTVLTEYITPPFVFSPVPDKIPVEYCAATGVTVGGVALTLIAITGRQWGGG